jgi:hypothetical protein
MPPAKSHFLRGVIRAHSTQLAGKIFYQSASIVVREPIFKVMQAGQIFAGAVAAPITIKLDIVQQRRRGPLRLWFIEHAGEAEGDLKKRQQSIPKKIRRGCLDLIVDLERERFVAGSAGAKPTAAVRSPMGSDFSVRLRLLDQVVKFFATFEDRLEREGGRIRQADSGAEEKQKCEPRFERAHARRRFWHKGRCARRNRLFPSGRRGHEQDWA